MSNLMISILFIAGYAFVVYIILSLLPFTNGYNLTEEDIKEERLLQTCIQLQITSPGCSEIWGGINTDNGEPQK